MGEPTAKTLEERLLALEQRLEELTRIYNKWLAGHTGRLDAQTAQIAQMLQHVKKLAEEADASDIRENGRWVSTSEILGLIRKELVAMRDRIKAVEGREIESRLKPMVRSWRKFPWFGKERER